METLSTTVVREAVTKELQQEGQTVDQIGTNVEKAAQEFLEEISQKFGINVKELAGPVMAEARGYHEERNRMYDPNAKISDLRSKGAAGVTEMRSKTVTMDAQAMEFEVKDQGYWERVGDHERIHQEDQAASYNAAEVAFIGDDGNMQTTEVEALIEWHPSSEANNPEDLTPEYQGFVQEGEKLGRVVGANRIKEALKSGDMQALQKDILEKQRERIASAQTT